MKQGVVQEVQAEHHVRCRECRHPSVDNPTRTIHAHSHNPRILLHRPGADIDCAAVVQCGLIVASLILIGVLRRYNEFLNMPLLETALTPLRAQRSGCTIQSQD